MAEKTNVDWKDTAKRGLGTLVKVGLGGLTPIIMMLMLRMPDPWYEMIAFIMLMWGTLVVVVSTIVDASLGTLTAEETQKAKSGIEEAMDNASIGLDGTIMQKQADVIEAKDKKISLKQLKERRLKQGL